MQNKARTKMQKVLLLLPIFLLALAGLAFALINLVHTGSNKTQPAPTKNALNTQLPPPDLPHQDKTKLELYVEAARDSAKRQAEWEKDPNSKRFIASGQPQAKPSTAGSTVGLSSAHDLPLIGNSAINPNEKKVNERLEKIYATLDHTLTAPSTQPAAASPSTLDRVFKPEMRSPETDRLEKLLQVARQPDTASDPTLDQAAKLLDKLSALQHPEAKVSTPDTVTAKALSSIYPVTTAPTVPVDTLLADTIEMDADDNSPNAFYGLDTDTDPDKIAETHVATIRAVVPEEQTLQSGSTIKLRLLQDIYVGRHRIPANNFIYGTCTVNNQRLQVQLTSAIENNTILPIALKVYDLDGLEGIFVPGAVTRDVAKDGFSQGVSSMGLNSLDPSLAGQAAAAGIETAKTLFSKKIKAVVVTVRAGHRVLLQSAGNMH